AETRNGVFDQLPPNRDGAGARRRGRRAARLDLGSPHGQLPDGPAAYGPACDRHRDRPERCGSGRGRPAGRAGPASLRRAPGTGPGSDDPAGPGRGAALGGHSATVHPVTARLPGSRAGRARGPAVPGVLMISGSVPDRRSAADSRITMVPSIPATATALPTRMYAPWAPPT